MDWFLDHRDLRRERVNGISEEFQYFFVEKFELTNKKGFAEN